MLYLTDTLHLQAEDTPLAHAVEQPLVHRGEHEHMAGADHSEEGAGTGDVAVDQDLECPGAESATKTPVCYPMAEDTVDAPSSSPPVAVVPAATYEPPMDLTLTLPLDMLGCDRGDDSSDVDEHSAPVDQCGSALLTAGGGLSTEDTSEMDQERQPELPSDLDAAGCIGPLYWAANDEQRSDVADVSTRDASLTHRHHDCEEADGTTAADGAPDAATSAADYDLSADWLGHYEPMEVGENEGVLQCVVQKVKTARFSVLSGVEGRSSSSGQETVQVQVCNNCMCCTMLVRCFYFVVLCYVVFCHIALH